MAVSLLAAFTCLTACAAPVLDAAAIEAQSLPNGMRVVVKQAPGADLVAVGLVVKASPLYENDQERGLSDITRYMMLDVAPEGGQSVGLALNDRGATFDSFTSLDGTQIRLVAAKEAIGELLPVLVKAVFEPKFDEAAWAEQLPELRRNLLDLERRPLGRQQILLWETAFPEHPYGRPVAGTAAGVAAYDAEDLAAFHKKLYVPNNMSLVVVGDVTTDEVIELATRLLGGYPSQPLEPPTVAPPAPVTESRTRLEKAPIRGTIVTYGWHAAGMDKKRDVCTLDLIYAFLGEGREARIAKGLEEAGIKDAAPEVEFITRRDPGLFTITLLCQPESELGAREVLLHQVERLRTEPVTADELAVARAAIHAGYAFDNQSFAGQVGSMGFYEAIDTYQFAVDYLSEVDKVTVEDIQRVAADYLNTSRSSLVIIRPKKAGEGTKEARLIP